MKSYFVTEKTRVAADEPVEVATIAVKSETLDPVSDANLNATLLHESLKFIKETSVIKQEIVRATCKHDELFMQLTTVGDLATSIHNIDNA